jgi:FixJ family two-component response regulator
MEMKELNANHECTHSVNYRSYDDTPLGARLRSLFNGANNSEIARRLGVHNSTIHTIAVTGKISARMLAKVVNLTGCNAAWLRSEDEHLR